MIGFGGSNALPFKTFSSLYRFTYCIGGIGYDEEKAVAGGLFDD